jgi:hypothetical protein
MWMKFKEWVVDTMWIDCPFCFGMRFFFLGLVVGAFVASSVFYMKGF